MKWILDPLGEAWLHFFIDRPFYINGNTLPGWTTVFPLVSGIVLEIGGQLSHGAIIAREHAIPVVINVQGAMLCIRDGQTIMVDGTSGRVYLDEAVS